MSGIDQTLLLRLQDDLGADRDVMRELIDTFLQEVPRRLADMRAALAAGDAGGLHRGAHSLKSTSAALGASALAALCRTLEADSAAGLPPDAAATLARVEHEWARVKSDLEGWLRA